MASVFSEIPVLDVRAAVEGETPTEAFAETFTKICHEVGFALVVNHGISADLTSELFDMMHRFFALPESDKRRIDKTRSAQFRGWEPIGAETTDNKPDQREQIDVWTDWPVSNGSNPVFHRLYGPNQWLPDDVLAGHQSISERWINANAALAGRLLGALAMGLGLEHDHLDRLFGDRPMSLAKFIHYPPTPSNGAGVNPHHDAGFLTVLTPGPTAGLQVQNQRGEWIEVPYVEDALVINLGEILQNMTGNYLVATPHRVITADERFSAGYFHGPSLDTELAPLPLDPQFAEAVAASPHHQTAGFMPTPEQASKGLGAMASDHRPDTYGEQLWNYFSRSYADQMAAHHSDILTP